MTVDEALAEARRIITKHGDIRQETAYGLAFVTTAFPSTLRAIQALRPAGSTPFVWKDWR